MQKRILVVEDEYSIHDILIFALRREGYEVRGAYDGKTTSELLDTFNPDLILLDAMLPDADGFEICKQVAHNYHVVMVTAKNEMFDKIIGLELGADDYITKPFEIKEVLVRIKALFRTLDKKRVVYEKDHISLTAEVSMDQDGERVFFQDEEVKLKRKEWELLNFLVCNRNHVFSREELLESVWGYDYMGESRTVDVHIRRLRAKLGLEKDHLIETVFGKGYVMR
ncbi:MAG: response regulator transcription factor [Cellulosilyticaceae bacterium]